MSHDKNHQSLWSFFLTDLEVAEVALPPALGVERLLGEDDPGLAPQTRGGAGEGLALVGVAAPGTLAVEVPASLQLLASAWKKNRKNIKLISRLIR